VVAYWIHTKVVMGSNPDRAICLVSCRRRIVILYFTKKYCSEVVYFSKIYYHTSLYDPAVRDTIVDSTSQVSSFAMFILPIVGNETVRV
jgi:hypothetical protein